MTATALDELGATPTTLSPDEKALLDEYGYLSLGPVLSAAEVAALNTHIEALLAAEGERAGIELSESKYIRHPKETGATRLADLVNKGALFDIFYTHPRVLAAVAHVLGPELQLSSLNYRAALPGMGLQQLHVDWHEPVAPGDYKVCNSIWLLDDFHSANGATRIVPGTHRHSRLPQVALDDPIAPHPDEVILEAPAGTVVVFNSHTWHGGTTNRTPQPRRAVHSYFCRRDQPQQIDQRRYIRAETLARIGEAGRTILGV